MSNATETINSKKTTLEQVLSLVSKTQIEITVRGLNDFTLSTEGLNAKALARVKTYFETSGTVSGWEVIEDVETDMTFAYFNLKAGN